MKTAWSINRDAFTVSCTLKAADSEVVLIAECNGFMAEAEPVDHPQGGWCVRIDSPQFCRLVSSDTRHRTLYLRTPEAQEMQEALKTANEKLVDIKQQEPLVFTVQRHRYFALDMDMEELVLRPSKPPKFWSGDETEAMLSLGRVLGTSHAQYCDDLNADKLNVAEGDELTLDDLDHYIVADREARREAKQKRQAKREAKLAEAKRTGKPVVLRRWTEGCSDPREECNLDIHYEYAMPDGTIKHEWHHTW